jgi:hypothetical protein
VVKTCPYCDDIMPEERFDEHLQAHLDAAQKIAPPPHGRFRLKCSDTGCILYKGTYYPEVGHAELVAWAHESRFTDEGSHFCTVEELDLVQPSKKPAAATGDEKEAAHG